MSNVTKVTKILALDLTNVPVNKISKVKQEVGNFLLNETIRYVDGGNSPVEGERKFALLDKEYAKEEHGGNRISRLQLDGDMLEAFKVKDIGGNKLEIGINGKQAPKADGHNQISGEAKSWASKSGMPKRRFVPDKKQTYKKEIMGKVNSIISNYREKIEFTFADEEIETVVETPEKTAVTIDNLFYDDTIENLLLQELNKRGF